MPVAQERIQWNRADFPVALRMQAQRRAGVEVLEVVFLQERGIVGDAAFFVRQLCAENHTAERLCSPAPFEDTLRRPSEKMLAVQPQIRDHVTAIAFRAFVRRPRPAADPNVFFVIGRLSMSQGGKAAPPSQPVPSLSCSSSSPRTYDERLVAGRGVPGWGRFKETREKRKERNPHFRLLSCFSLFSFLFSLVSRVQSISSGTGAVGGGKTLSSSKSCSPESFTSSAPALS